MSDNRAWVEIETGLAPDALREHCADLERLFRLNPLRPVEAWLCEGSRVRARLRDLAKERAVDLAFSVERRGDVVSLRYALGLKVETAIAVDGSRLTITETYADLPAGELKARMDEVDGTLNAWGHGIHDFFRRWRRWHWLPGWRWYIARVWLPMSPGARRVTSLLIVISWIELLVFAAMAAALGLGMNPFDRFG